jgi:two-component system response regulator PrrA
LPEVLYIEDDDIFRELYADYLRESGVTVRELRLAEHCLRAVRETPPDAVLLDLTMPPGEMSGAEVLARLREDPASASIPVILFSGLGNIVNPEIITALRVSAVVPKPARGRHLLDVLMSVLSRRPPAAGPLSREPAPVTCPRRAGHH